MATEPAEIYKVLLMGDIAVGKTSLLLRIVDNTFSASPLQTVIDSKGIECERGGKRIKINLWDTGGQERFGTVTSSFYRAAHGVILVYDVTDKKSLANVRCWNEEIERYSRTSICKILVGSKSDLKGASSPGVPPADVESVAKCVGAKAFEVSSLTGDNVHTAFEALVSSLILTSSHFASSSSLSLGSSSSSSESSKCC